MGFRSLVEVIIIYPAFWRRNLSAHSQLGFVSRCFTFESSSAVDQVNIFQRLHTGSLASFPKHILSYIRNICGSSTFQTCVAFTLLSRRIWTTISRCVDSQPNQSTGVSDETYQSIGKKTNHRTNTQEILAMEHGP